MDKENIKQIEAILFSCGRKIEPEEIGKLVGIPTNGPIKNALKNIKKEYDERESPMMVIEEGNGYKMTVREKYLVTVRNITPYMEFSKTLMETLAVVAWKQPIMQSDVIRIRTNKAYDHIMELEKMGFLAKERHGRSYLLKLSQKFYDYFDLRDDVDVKKLFKHIKDLEPEEQKKVGEYSQDEEIEKKLEENPEENLTDNEDSKDSKDSKDNEDNEDSKDSKDSKIDLPAEHEDQEPEKSQEMDVIDEISHDIEKKPETELEIEDDSVEDKEVIEEKKED